MVAGSLGIEDRLSNEYYALLEGLKEAYYKDYTNIVLETDHVEAYWNWYNSYVLGSPPEHEFVVQQLNQRKSDKNFKTEIRLADPEDNLLAVYLANHGAANWNRMVVIREMFGRVRELWMRDMGLGSAVERFQAVYEEDLDARRLEEEVVDPINVGNNEIEVAADQEGAGNGMEEDDMVEENNNFVVIGLAAPGAGAGALELNEEEFNGIDAGEN